MKKISYLLILLTVIALVPQVLIAKTGYVSDILLLTFREGPGTSYPVIKTLTSSTQVEVLEEKDGFFKVELTAGETGWVDKKFIIFELPNALIVKQHEQQIARLQNKISILQSRQDELKSRLASSNDENIKKITSLQTDLDRTKSQNQTLTRSLSEAESRYATLIRQSKNIQQIVTENKTIKTENQSLKTSLEQLEKKNKSMFKTGMIKWFVAGVGTLLFGWILGQSVSSRRRSGSSLLD